MPRLWVCVLTALALIDTRPSLRDVLRRAGAYSVQYGAALTAVVADEDYRQQLLTASGEVLRTRVLRSEIAFVRLADTTEWQAFRDVVSVDGEAVGGSGGRLERLLRDAPPSAISQARLLAEASARYNLGALRRDFNAPTTALQFVHPAHQDRFRFDKQAEAMMDGERVWVVRFKERTRGTLIRTTDGRSVPVEGVLHIAPDDGRIVRARFTARGFLPDATGTAEIDVSWRNDPRLSLWVPSEMGERYEGPGLGAETRDASNRDPGAIVGTASYSAYRRFGVDVRIVRSP